MNEAKSEHLFWAANGVDILWTGLLLFNSQIVGARQLFYKLIASAWLGLHCKILTFNESLQLNVNASCSQEMSTNWQEEEQWMVKGFESETEKGME